MPHPLIEDLQWRGLIHQCTDLAALDAQLTTGPVTLYCGFDPTAVSLHVGSLIPLISLARFQHAGNRVLGLVGGATGLIGDPSGKSAERVLQTSHQVASRSAAVLAQMARFIELSDPARGLLVDNLSWTAGVGLLEFLRDVGKHFSVNAMVSRDSVRSRLEREGDGISFTEFSYMLLQANDFLQLFEREGCRLQVGGSDQWGNMCSGADLVRRVHGEAVLAMTLPLLTNSSGEKFGKTANGTVWLDAEMTSPWEFFQFWRNVDDSDVVRFLKMFTFLDRPTIEALARATAAAPHERQAQRRLARELTAMVHGAATADALAEVARVLFEKAPVDRVSLAALKALHSVLPRVTVGQHVATEMRVTQALIQLGLDVSGNAATKSVKAGAVQVNGVAVCDPLAMLGAGSALHGRFWLLRRGKTNFGLVEVTTPECAGGPVP